MGYKLKRILIYPDGVTEKQVYPAGWKPGANTIAYFPFISDAIDETGNYTLSNTGTQGTIGRVFSASSNFSANTPADGCFVNMWIKRNTMTTGSGSSYFQVGNAICGSKGGMCYNPRGNSTVQQDTVQYYVGNNMYTSSVGSTQGQWFNLCFGYDGSGGILYMNGVSTRINTGSPRNRGQQNTFIYIENITGSVEISRFIAEKVFWTADEILNYYNKTKSKYGL